VRSATSNSRPEDDARISRLRTHTSQVRQQCAMVRFEWGIRGGAALVLLA
jgi:hypothetical protein